MQAGSGDTTKNQPVEERRRITIEPVVVLAAERNPDQAMGGSDGFLQES